MISRGLSLFIGSVVAVALPAVFLHFTADSARLAAGLTVAPFGWPRLFVAHLVAALHLAWLLASWLRTIPAVSDSPRAIGIGVGVTFAGLGLAIMPGFGDAVISGELGFIAALVLRSLLALGLVLPWCVAFVPKDLAGPPGWALALGLGAALLPAGLYSQAVIDSRTATARDDLDRERLAKARPIVVGLCELGSEEPFGQATPTQVLKYLDKTLPKVEQAVLARLPAKAPPSARFERASQLVRLNRLDEAAELVRPLASADPTAGFFLAGICRDLNRWTESDELFTKAIEHFGPRASTDPNAGEMCRMAYEGRVFIARQSGRPAEAERLLREGLEKFPSEAAFFHYELGRHHADGGRPAQAANHLAEAARLDPKRYGEPVEKLRQSLLTGPLGCRLPSR